MSRGDPPTLSWPLPVTDEQAVFFALSTIASWGEWCETGGPSLSDATNLVMQRVAEAREARGPKAREGWASATELADEDGLLLIAPLRLRGVNTLGEDDVRVTVTWESP